MAPKVPTKKKSEYALSAAKYRLSEKGEGGNPEKMRKGFKHDLENTPWNMNHFLKPKMGVDGR